MLALGAALLDIVLAWVIWRMLRQARLYRALPAAEGGSGMAWPSVAVIVPARNEADVIGRCVTGLVAQDYAPERLCFRLVDDGSRDETLRVAAAAAGGDPRFRVIPATPLPERWTGKSHACWEGAVAAGSPDYLCFVDADTAAAPQLIRTAVAHALRDKVDMVSLEPFQELGGVLERLVIPCGLFLIAGSQDVAAASAPDRPEAPANGQFILIARSAYGRVGGHAAVRSEICEDAALARLVKCAGLRYELLGAEHLIRCRMYRNARDLWHGLAKNVTALGGGPARTVLIAGAGLLMAAAGPVFAGLAVANIAGESAGAGDIAAAVLALCGLCAMLGLHLAGSRHFRIPLAFGPLFPLGYALAFALALDGARRDRLGRVRWKDRSYRVRDPAEVRADPRTLSAP